MKNKFIVFLFLFSFYSCDNDLLTPFTPGALTEEVAITTVADLTRITNNCYVSLFNRGDIQFSSVFTDEVSIGLTNGGQGISDNYAFFLTPSSFSPALIWETCAITLARVNKVLTNADKLLLNTSLNANNINILKAEALMLRAFCHLRMIAYFSTNPKDDNVLGGILALKEVGLDQSLPRENNKAIYKSIHEDLDKAIILFGGVPFDNSRANKTAAIALKARAYAYKGDYNNALIYANQVIATSGSVSLAKTTEYRNIFWTDSNNEVIFKIIRVRGQSAQATNIGNIWASVNATIGGSPFYEINRSLFNLLSIDDIRYQTIVAPSSKIDPNYLTSNNYKESDVLVVGKHPGTSNKRDLNNDFKLIRMSEMYFIKAEAEVSNNELTNAANTLKFLLDNRYTSPQPLPVFSNQTEAWKFILDQRRIEFAFEGYRFIDLKRLGALANVGIERHPLDCNGPNCKLPVNDYRFALPIPNSELNSNPGIKQNPGY
jgi:starch-binding outer membrane protein, SusD/RagB family